MNTLAIAALLSLAGPSWAYLSLDCDVDVQVENRINDLDIDQQVGAERIECAAGGARVVRIVKTGVSVEARADAKADGDADARYSDSCTCSCGDCSSETCRTSGWDSDRCWDSDSDTATERDFEETKFVVAYASGESLRQRGFSARQGEEPFACELVDTAGASVGTLKGIALITWIYGEELMREKGADFEALLKLRKQDLRAAPRVDRMLKKKVPFDGQTEDER